MADFKQTLMGIWAEGVKAVNTAAKSVAGVTRYKLDELDNVSRRREAIAELGEKIFELYQAGVEMPEEVQPLLAEMRTLDENLDKMRSEHAEQKKANADQRAQARAEAKQKRAEAKQARADATAEAIDAEPADEIELELEPVEADVQDEEPVVEAPVVEAAADEEEPRQSDEPVV